MGPTLGAFLMCVRAQKCLLRRHFPKAVGVQKVSPQETLFEGSRMRSYSGSTAVFLVKCISRCYRSTKSHLSYKGIP